MNSAFSCREADALIQWSICHNPSKHSRLLFFLLFFCPFAKVPSLLYPTINAHLLRQAIVQKHLSCIHLYGACLMPYFCCLTLRNIVNNNLKKTLKVFMTSGPYQHFIRWGRSVFTSDSLSWFMVMHVCLSIFFLADSWEIWQKIVLKYT